MKSATLRIEGMHCEGCAAIIQALLQRTAGVQQASAAFKEAEARILYDPHAVTEEQLVKAIEKAGYRAAAKRRVNSSG